MVSAAFISKSLDSSFRWNDMSKNPSSEETGVIPRLRACFQPEADPPLADARDDKKRKLGMTREEKRMRRRDVLERAAVPEPARRPGTPERSPDASRARPNLPSGAEG